MADLPRLRREYTVRTPNGWRTYRSRWVDSRSYSAAVVPETQTLEVSRPRVREHHKDVWKTRKSPPCRFCGRRRYRRPDCRSYFLRHVLAHEIGHLIYERPSEVSEPHFRWEFAHDDLAGHVARVDRILRTGVDVPARGK